MNGSANGYAAFSVGPPVVGIGKLFSAFNSDDILMWEQDATPGYFNDGGNYPFEGISGRHGIGALCGSASGSAEYMNTNLWYSIAGTNVADWNTKPRNRVNNNPSTANGH